MDSTGGFPQVLRLVGADDESFAYVAAAAADDDDAAEHL